jgi:hypothetical protein
MKTLRLLSRLTAALVLISGATSCTTTYDAYGRPVQSVDPGLAVAGAAAAGIIGYAIANDRKDHYDHHHYHHHHGYYRPHPRHYRRY